MNEQPLSESKRVALAWSALAVVTLIHLYVLGSTLLLLVVIAFQLVVFLLLLRIGLSGLIAASTELAGEVQSLRGQGRSPGPAEPLRRGADWLARTAASSVARYRRQDEFDADHAAAALCPVQTLGWSPIKTRAVGARSAELSWRDRIAGLQAGGSFSQWLRQELTPSKSISADAGQDMDKYTTHPSLSDRLSALSWSAESETPEAAGEGSACGLALLAEPDALAEKLISGIQQVLAEEEEKDNARLRRWNRKTGHSDRGKLQSAILNARRAACISPNSREVLQLLIDLLLESGYLREAEERLSRLGTDLRSDRELTEGSSPLNLFCAVLHQILMLHPPVPKCQAWIATFPEGNSVSSRPPDICCHPQSKPPSKQCERTLRSSEPRTAKCWSAAVSRWAGTKTWLALQFQWFYSVTNAFDSAWVALAGATNASLVLAPVTRSEAGLYYVVATNALGAALSQPALLQVEPALGAPPSFVFPQGSPNPYLPSPDGECLLAPAWFPGTNGLLFGALLFNGRTGQPKTNFNLNIPMSASAYNQTLPEAISPDSRNLAVGTLTGDIQLHSLTTGARVGVLTNSGPPIASLVFSPTGKLVAAGATDAAYTLQVSPDLQHWQDWTNGVLNATAAFHETKVQSESPTTFYRARME
jgi:hypothetical protein